MQKLIAIHIKGHNDEQSTELLAEYTNDGWRVVSVTAAGAGQETYRSFLVVVVLEKP